MARRKKQPTPAERDEQLADQIAVQQTSTGDTISDNQNLIFGILVGLVVLIGGYLAYKTFIVGPKEQKAIAEIYKAEQLFERDSFGRALTNPGAGYPGFEDVASEFSATPTGNLANYYAGISYLNLGQFEAAISYLDDFDAEGEVLPIMKAGALGDAHSELGNFDQALRYYKEAADTEENAVLTPYFLKKTALLLEKQQQLSEAAEYYETIQREYPNSVEARDIDKYLMRVGSTD